MSTRWEMQKWRFISLSIILEGKMPMVIEHLSRVADTQQQARHKSINSLNPYWHIWTFSNIRVEVYFLRLEFKLSLLKLFGKLCVAFVSKHLNWWNYISITGSFMKLFTWRWLCSSKSGDYCQQTTSVTFCTGNCKNR